MNKRYYPVSLEEIMALLQPLGFTIDNPDDFNREYVLSRPVKMKDDTRLRLRVWTANDNYGARKAGKDAIRVVLQYTDPETERIVWGSGTKRVHRLPTWEKNLMNRITNWKLLLPKKQCPKCGAPMQQRTSQSGNEFFGCVRFPRCRGTLSFNE